MKKTNKLERYGKGKKHESVIKIFAKNTHDIVFISNMRSDFVSIGFLASGTRNES